jgi:hypothetical protein
MVASLAFLMCGVAAAADDGWLADYGQALKAAQAARSPLLVVLHNPDDRSHQATGGGQVAPASAQMQRAPSPDPRRNYVLCAIDVATPYGQQMAKAFKATRFPHNVIIDRTASVQIYKKTGKLTAAQWVAALDAHRDGRRYVPPTWQEPVVCST